MDFQSQIPGSQEQLNYGLQLQIPSYQSDLPQDLPYDPGASSSLFDLNYMPSSGLPIYIIPIFVLIIGIVLYFILKKFRNLKYLLSIGFITALSLAFFGPLNLPSILHFRTILGSVKMIGGVTLIAVFVYQMIEKKFSLIFSSKSFIPISLFLISQMLSVFTMTNVAYFINDFGILITGIMFFYLAYYCFSWKESTNLFIIYIYCLLIASVPILLVFVYKAAGVSLISSIYPKYENSVFLHDLDRHRIFSIIDFEYFTPCLVFALFYKFRNKLLVNKYLNIFVTSISMISIVLVNYRYRFLTFILGFILMYIYLKQYRRKILTLCLGTLSIIFCIYLAFSFVTSRNTIIDRFLMKSQTEDVDSVDRRFVMFRQALDLFTQAPILGVGTGNYKDNVQIVYSMFGGRTYEPYYKILENVYAYPHNWFLTILAENGLVGFLVFMWMLFIFIEIDFKLWKKLKGNELLTFSTLSSVSWIWVFANQFTMMHVSLPTVIIFWAFRGMIERIYDDKISYKIGPEVSYDLRY
jgi:O-antigen ligase